MGLAATWWDYNGDGCPDIYVSNDFLDPDFLYRGNCDGTFTDVSKKALPHTAWFSMGSDFADLNNDGRFDFMASDMAGSTHYKQKVGMGSMGGPGSVPAILSGLPPSQYMRNAAFLNSGTDRFMEVAYLTGLESTDWTWSVKFGDLDNDGLQDVFITTGMTRNYFNSNFMSKHPFDFSFGAYQLESYVKVFNKAPPLLETNRAFRNLGNLEFANRSVHWGLDHKGVSFGAAYSDLDRDGDPGSGGQ